MTTHKTIMGERWIFQCKVVPESYRVIINVKRLPERLPLGCPHITKLVAWDFAIGEDAEPVLIEVNIERTSIQSFQDSTGPILGDYVSYFLQNAPAAVDVPVAYRLLKAFSKVCRVIRKPFR